MSITLVPEGNLTDFTNRSKLTIHITGHPSVKDVAESAGIPHVEIGSVSENGNFIGFDTAVKDGDRFRLIPADWKNRVLSGNLQPPWPDGFRFVLDVHLGRLAREMRLLGLDVKYRNDYSDNDIVDITYREQRFVLTRDLGLLKHGSVSYGHWMRHIETGSQIGELLAAFDLDSQIYPFSRCLTCNSILAPVEKKTVSKLLPPRVKKNYRNFRQCPGCGKIYWKGSHYERMKHRLREKYHLKVD